MDKEFDPWELEEAVLNNESKTLLYNDLESKQEKLLSIYNKPLDEYSNHETLLEDYSTLLGFFRTFSRHNFSSDKAIINAITKGTGNSESDIRIDNITEAAKRLIDPRRLKNSKNDHNSEKFNKSIYGSVYANMKHSENKLKILSVEKSKYLIRNRFHRKEKIKLAAIIALITALITACITIPITTYVTRNNTQEEVAHEDQISN